MIIEVQINRQNVSGVFTPQRILAGQCAHITVIVIKGCVP